MHYRLCPKHAEENQRKIAAFARARPDASVEAWEKFFGPNTDWQLRMQLTHCGEGNGLAGH
jgi:hypothetical protein